MGLNGHIYPVKLSWMLVNELRCLRDRLIDLTPLFVISGQLKSKNHYVSYEILLQGKVKDDVGK